ncbi:MAG: right-handed parallel beta-helix repeat-containing protein [Planctomycetota bacterium]
MLRLLRLALVVPTLLLAAPGQQRVFVDARALGSGDGSSWANAHTDLQAALARPGALEIWVAEGTYHPSAGGDRNATFTLRSGIAVYGGFSGVETEVWQRNARAHPTVLSGDLNGDDVTGSGLYWYSGAAGFGENSYRVITAEQADASTVLDGCVVEGGYAYDTTGGVTAGGGLFARDSALTVRGCTFRHNFAYWYGGAVALFGGQPTLAACTVVENMVSDGRGGGVALSGTVAATLRDDQFRANTARGYVDGSGGALYIDFDAGCGVSGCRFVGNESRIFAGGRSPATGGAVFNGGTGTAFARCAFVGNLSNYGGGIFSYRGMAVSDCLFDGNRVANYNGLAGSGAGLAAVGLVTPIGISVRGCTFVHGVATDDGGGMFVSNITGPVTGCVFWNNRDVDGSIGRSQCRGANPRYSCVQNLLVGPPNEDPPDPRNYPGSIALDPVFVDADGPDNLAGNEDDDLRLTAASPCIDVAEAAVAVGPLDVGGMPRRLDGDLDGTLRADMGAHEFGLAALRTTVARSLSQVDVDLDVLGAASTLGFLCIGVPGPGLPILTLGELAIDLQQPLLVVPLGPLPAHLALGVAPSGARLQAQPLGLTTSLRGTFGNAITLDL